jgi:hypothetical protein
MFGVLVNSLQWVSTMAPTTRRFRAITPASPAVGQFDDLGARHHGLGRDTGDVDAGAPDLAPLDQGDPVAGIRQCHGQRLAAFSAAEDDVVELLHGSSASRAWAFGHRHSGETSP